ncbi:MAG: hypothetical protein QM811_15975 [Pirellulales bacterium]
MPVRFPCTSCGQLLGIGTRKIGTNIACPNCRTGLTVPDQATAALMRAERRHGELPTAESVDTPPEIATANDFAAFFGNTELDDFLQHLDKPLKVAAKQAPTTAKSDTPTAPVEKPTAKTQAKVTASSVNGATTHAANPSPAPPAPETFHLDEPGYLELIDEVDAPATLPFSSPAPSANQVAPPQPKRRSVTDGTAPVIPQPKAFPEPKPLPQPKTQPQPAAAAKASPPAHDPAGAIDPATFFDPVPAPDTSTKLAAAQAFLLESAPTAVAQATTATQASSAQLSSASQPPFDDGVWISRRVLIGQVGVLTVLTLAAFAVGWLSGGAGRNRMGDGPMPTTLDLRIRALNAEKQTVADPGAAVLVWPANRKPLEKLSVKGVSPKDAAPAADAELLKSLSFLGAVYGRTDSQGELASLTLPQPGEYYVLAISKLGKRPDGDALKPAVLRNSAISSARTRPPQSATRRFRLKNTRWPKGALWN